MVDGMDFIDQLHRDCHAAVFDIRREFARLHAGVQLWEPEPCPPRFTVVSDRTPFLDEVERPQRPWFR